MTLTGRRIVITRSRHQAEELTTLIADLGGIPVLYPCIEIAPPKNTKPIDSALKTIKNYDWIVFTSSNTVQAIQNRLNALELSINWNAIKIAAVGEKTNRAIAKNFGRIADFIPNRHRASDLAIEIPIFQYEKILLPQSALADDTLGILLTERSAIVDRVAAYENIIGSGGADVPALLQGNQIDAITFTSASTVNNFIERIIPLTAFDIPVVCIGISTYEAALEAGFHQVFYPKNYTIPDMLELLVELFEKVEYDNS